MSMPLKTEKIFELILESHQTIKLTALRKDILSIFIESQKPISAYDALNILKTKRESAEPPTVYRVIEYFVKNKLIHRIDAENKYVFCSQLQKPTMTYHGILFVCQKK